MKKLIIILAAAAMAGCGIYKPYTRPEELQTDGLYGQGVETVDTMTLCNISWQEMFTDPYLQQLIPVSYTHLDVYKRQGYTLDADPDHFDPRVAGGYDDL